MHSPTFPTSPLAVIHTTIVASTSAGAVLLLALVFALLDPSWSRAVLALQAVTLAVMGLAWRWGPPRHIAIYALLLSGAAMLWDPTLPPAAVPDEPVRDLLPFVVCVVVLTDLLQREVRSFRPARIRVYAGLVDLAEAACFFRSDPAWLYGRLTACNARLMTAPDGSTLVAVADVLAVLRERGPDPDLPGTAHPLRD